MNILHEFDTIAAVATPMGMGGVGVIRISGEKAFEIIEKIFEKYKENKNIYKKEIVNLLGTKYSAKEVDNAFNIFENLTYDSILNIVLKENEIIDGKELSVYKSKFAKLYLEREIKQISLAEVFE